MWDSCNVVKFILKELSIFTFYKDILKEKHAKALATSQKSLGGEVG